ncbi:MAG: hypothetical protein ACFE9L_21690 [Candidatus Hodarchaeota archaeon]
MRNSTILWAYTDKVPLEQFESVSDMLSVIQSSDMKSTGTFLD